MKMGEIKVGMMEDYSQTITDADIKIFAGISGDHNPIHVSDEYAEQSRFKRRIAHGMISASFFSAMFGTKIPGNGCVLVSQSINFRKPVYIGDTVTASIKVISVDVKSNRVFFDTVGKVKRKVVIDGSAELYLPNMKKQENING